MLKISLILLFLCTVASAQVKLIFKVFDSDTTSSAYKRGDMVEILPDSVFAGNVIEPTGSKYAGNWVIVHVSDLTMAQARNYGRKYKPVLGKEIINSNANGIRVRVWVDNVNLSGVGVLTRDKIESLIEQYGGSVRSIDYNEVIFDIPHETKIELQEFVRDKIENIILKKAKFYITSAQVQTIIDAGGEVTINTATLLNQIKDKQND